MADTQFPRYQVFIQERPGAPHVDAGTVHATDAELALLNARDVFVRRPECAGLWVAPAQAIFSRTAEELQDWQDVETSPDAGAPESVYYVFKKERSAGAMTLAGQVTARTPQDAMRRAVQQLAGKRSAFAWWVLPASQVTASDPADAGSLFAPARDKPFRLATDFHTLTAMRKIKGEGQGDQNRRKTNGELDDHITPFLKRKGAGG